MHSILYLSVGFKKFLVHLWPARGTHLWDNICRYMCNRYITTLIWLPTASCFHCDRNPNWPGRLPTVTIENTAYSIIFWTLATCMDGCVYKIRCSTIPVPCVTYHEKIKVKIFLSIIIELLEFKKVFLNQYSFSSSVHWTGVLISLLLFDKPLHTARKKNLKWLKPSCCTSP